MALETIPAYGYKRRRVPFHGARLFFLFCLATLLVAGCAENPRLKRQEKAKRIATLHGQGLKSFEAKQYADAIKAWKDEVVLEPKNAGTLADIANAYRESGEYPTAIIYYRRAIALGGNPGRSYYGLGLSHSAMDRHEAAAEAFADAVSAGYATEDVYYNQGLSQLKLGNYGKAVAALKKTIGLNREHKDAHLYLGLCYLNMFDLVAAEEEFKEALAVNPQVKPAADVFMLDIETRTAPDNADALYRLGTGYACCVSGAVDFIPRAVVAFKKAIAVAPSYPGAHLGLGRLYEREGRPLDARREYRQELRYHPADREAASALAAVSAGMERPVDIKALMQPPSPFSATIFPQRVIAVSADAAVYDNDFNRKSGLAPGAGLLVAGLYDKVVKRSAFAALADQSSNGDYEVFYRIKDGAGVVAARDVAPQGHISTPLYESGNHKVAIVKNPAIVTFAGEDASPAYISYLWLRIGGREPVLLGQEAAGQAVHGISVSPDERFIFMPGPARIFDANGAALWTSKKSFVSPVWLEDKVYLRGVEDDAVYFYDLEKGEFHSFFDINEGAPIPVSVIGSAISRPAISKEGGRTRAVFFRRVKGAAAAGAECAVIEALASDSGTVVHKKTLRKEPCERAGKTGGAAG